MTEEETKSVTDQETAVPENNSEEVKPVQDDQNDSENTEPKEGSKEFNFARLRQKNENLERQIYELRERLERKETPPQEPDELDSLADDDILTKKQAERLAEKRAEEQIKKILAEKEKASLPEKTRSQYQDFDQIMTLENVKKFEQTEPGLAAACASAPNPWEATYKIIKKFMAPDSVKPNKNDQIAEENLSKPLSSNSVGRRGPLANANLWAEASKDELYKEMMDAAKRG